MDDLSPSSKAQLLRWAIKFHQKSQDASEALGLEALLRDAQAIEGVEGLEDLTAPLAAGLVRVFGGIGKLIKAHSECDRALAALIQFLASDEETVTHYRELTGSGLPDELPGVM